MKKGSLILVLCMTVAAGSALAEKVPGSNGSGYVPQGDCPTDGYKSFTGSGFQIPDNNPAGAASAPINVPDDGSTFTDVVVDLDMSHTWVGDVTVDVSYDVECDGVGDASARLICRPAQAACDPAGTTFGCSGDLAGTYRFSDDGAAPIGTGCPPVIGSGCYSPYSALSVFDGLHKGGCFTVSGNDGAGGDVGGVSAIVIWTANDGGGTPTETVSWGSVKARF
jgi:hypothetical protein